MNWYYLIDNHEVAGPVSLEELSGMLDSGALAKKSQVCTEGTEEWIELGEVLAAKSRRDVSPPSALTEVALANTSATRPHRRRGSRIKFAVGSVLSVAATVVAVLYLVLLVGNTPSESKTDQIERQESTVQEEKSGDPMNPTFPEDQMFLGQKYYYGWSGIPQDFEEAERWLRKSALQGNQLAQALLGQMYLKGEGVELDYKESARWWGYAAEQGLPIAQQQMGLFYLSGLAGEQNNKLAYMWLNLVAASDEEEIASTARELRSELASQMTGSDLKEAQRMSREWAPKEFAELDLPGTEDTPDKIDLHSYYKGLGFSENETAAVLEYFKKQLEPAEAMNVLAGLYETKSMWDPEKVMYWHYEAAKAGSGAAMHRLSVILHPDFALAYRGYPRGDAEQSHNWIRKAADAGNLEGLNGMGSALWFGVMNNEETEYLVEPNRREAVEWWRKAAQAGSSDAQDNLEKYQLEISAIEKEGK